MNLKKFQINKCGGRNDRNRNEYKTTGYCYINIKDLKPINFEALKVISNQTDNLLLAKSSLFEIAGNPTFERFENFMHGVRILAPLYGEKRAIEFLRKQSMIDTYGQMLDCGYLNKKLEI